MNVAKWFSTAAALSIAAVSGPALADGTEEFYHQLHQERFFNYQQNARATGMAGSSVVTSSDSSSVVGNPAGLGWMRNAEVSTTYAHSTLSGNDLRDYSDIEQDMNSGQVLGSIPLGAYSDAPARSGSLGFGWSGYDADTDDSLDMGVQGNRLHLAWGVALNEGWAVGYGVSYHFDKVNTDVFTDSMDDGVRQTAGVQYRLGESAVLGLSTFYGFGTREMSFGVDPDYSVGSDIGEWGMEGGVARQFQNTLLAASVDFALYPADDQPDGKAWGFKAGMEHDVFEWMKARMGYRYQYNYDYGALGNEEGDDETASFNAVTMGLGVAPWKHMAIDYAFEFRSIGEGDWTHVVTLSTPFSICN